MQFSSYLYSGRTRDQDDDNESGKKITSRRIHTAQTTQTSAGTHLSATHPDKRYGSLPDKRTHQNSFPRGPASPTAARHPEPERYRPPSHAASVDDSSNSARKTGASCGGTPPDPP